MDDAENYAQGARQLPILLQDSSKGSLLTGIGFAWDKFSAYASDWDEYAATPEGVAAGFAADAAPVSGFDIWSGGTREFSLPRGPGRLGGKSSLVSVGRTMTATPWQLPKRLESLRTGLGWLQQQPRRAQEIQDKRQAAPSSEPLVPRLQGVYHVPIRSAECPAGPPAAHSLARPGLSLLGRVTRSVQVQLARNFPPACPTGMAGRV